MKRLILFLGSTMLASSCLAIEMPQSAIELGCTNCHAMDRELVGPTWMAISNRYRGKRNDRGFLAQLVKNVSKGSQDRWGNLPMVASDPTGKKHAQIVEFLKFVLALSDRLPENQGKK